MINIGILERVSRKFSGIWNAICKTSQVTHGSNYMLANNRTESDRVVRKKGVIKKGRLNK